MSPASRRRAQRWAGSVASAGIVAWLLLVVLPEIGDVEGAGDLLGDRVAPLDVALLAAVLFAHLVAHGFTLSTTVRGLPVPTAVGIRVVSGGVGRLLPFGWAVGAAVLVAVLTARGVTIGAAGRALAVTGTWNFLTKLTLPLLAVVALAGWGLPADARGWATAALAVVALGGAVLIVRLALHEPAGRWLGRTVARLVAPVARWRDHPGVEALDDRLVGFQRATVSTLRERPVATAGWYFAYHFSHAALFWVALLAVTDGAVGATWPEVFAAFAAGYLLTGMPFTPGGLGAFDVVVVGGLTLAGENPDVATAAVALYRIATYAVYAPAAAAAWPTWRRLRARGRHAAAAGSGADANEARRRDAAGRSSGGG